MQEKQRELRFCDITRTKGKESFYGSTIKETVKNYLEYKKDEASVDVIAFSDLINGKLENTYPISDNVCYFVKYNKSNNSYFVKRDLEKSPKKSN